MTHPLNCLPLRAILMLTVMMTAFRPASAQEVSLTKRTTVVFAGIDEAGRVLGARDEFVRALSPFDRTARLRTDGEVAEADYLDFVTRQARPWQPEEVARVTTALRNISALLASWNIPFPTRIPLVKTTGAEEGNAAYTRGSAILLPERKILGKEDALDDLLLHELFHVLSRSQPTLRTNLYGVIGFRAINEITYPGDLARRKITNPDGVQTGWAITVTNQSQAITVVPILYSRTERYDVAKGGQFFDYLEFRLLGLEQVATRWQPKLVAGRPLLLTVKEVSGFHEQCGRNTQYIIHPDEILADNFVQLIKGRKDSATPRVLEEMAKVLRSAK